MHINQWFDRCKIHQPDCRNKALLFSYLNNLSMGIFSGVACYVIVVGLITDVLCCVYKLFWYWWLLLWHRDKNIQVTNNASPSNLKKNKSVFASSCLHRFAVLGFPSSTVNLRWDDFFFTCWQCLICLPV